MGKRPIRGGGGGGSTNTTDKQMPTRCYLENRLGGGVTNTE